MQTHLNIRFPGCVCAFVETKCGFQMSSLFCTLAMHEMVGGEGLEEEVLVFMAAERP